MRFAKKETTQPQVNQHGKSILFHNVPCFILSADMGLNFSRLINTIVPSGSVGTKLVVKIISRLFELTLIGGFNMILLSKGLRYAK